MAISGLSCARCREAVTIHGVSCVACSAAHHESCYQSQGHCSSCEAAKEPVPFALVAPLQAPRPSMSSGTWAVLAMLTMGVVLGSVSLRVNVDKAVTQWTGGGDGRSFAVRTTRVPSSMSTFPRHYITWYDLTGRIVAHLHHLRLDAEQRRTVDLALQRRDLPQDLLIPLNALGHRVTQGLPRLAISAGRDPQAAAGPMANPNIVWTPIATHDVVRAGRTWARIKLPAFTGHLRFELSGAGSMDLTDLIFLEDKDPVGGSGSPLEPFTVTGTTASTVSLRSGTGVTFDAPRGAIVSMGTDLSDWMSGPGGGTLWRVDPWSHELQWANPATSFMGRVPVSQLLDSTHSRVPGGGPDSATMAWLKAGGGWALLHEFRPRSARAQWDLPELEVKVFLYGDREIMLDWPTTRATRRGGIMVDGTVQLDDLIARLSERPGGLGPMGQVQAFDPYRRSSTVFNELNGPRGFPAGSSARRALVTFLSEKVRPGLASIDSVIPMTESSRIALAPATVVAGDQNNRTVFPRLRVIMKTVRGITFAVVTSPPQTGPFTELEVPRSALAPGSDFHVNDEFVLVQTRHTLTAPTVVGTTRHR